MTPHRSALGSPSKASEVYFMMLNTLKNKHNFYGEEHDVQSHMLRPTITDMQDKYCGDCYDIYHIQSQHTKVAAFGRATSFVVSFVSALNTVNIVAATTILVLHVGNGRSEHVRLDIMFLAIKDSFFSKCSTS